MSVGLRKSWRWRRQSSSHQPTGAGEQAGAGSKDTPRTLKEPPSCHTTAAAARTRRPSRKVATIVSLVAVPVALAASGLVVAQSSYSAYSATTVNPTSNWATGTVALDRRRQQRRRLHRQQPQARLHRQPLHRGLLHRLAALGRQALRHRRGDDEGPGQRHQPHRHPGHRRLFGSCTGYTPLATGSSVYTGTLAGFGSTATNFATGVGTWNTAGVATGAAAETRTYQITYSVRTETTNDTQGGTAAIGFTWEAQNS